VEDGGAVAAQDTNRQMINATTSPKGTIAAGRQPQRAGMFGAAGSGGSAGQGVGGGAYFATGGTVCLDAFTVANIIGNTASTSNNDIFGAFTIC
jgi:hypothetical protein